MKRVLFLVSAVLLTGVLGCSVADYVPPIIPISLHGTYSTCTIPSVTPSAELTIGSYFVTVSGTGDPTYDRAYRVSSYELKTTVAILVDGSVATLGSSDGKPPYSFSLEYPDTKRVVAGCTTP